MTWFIPSFVGVSCEQMVFTLWLLMLLYFPLSLFASSIAEDVSCCDGERVLNVPGNIVPTLPRTGVPIHREWQSGYMVNRNACVNEMREFSWVGRGMIYADLVMICCEEKSATKKRVSRRIPACQNKLVMIASSALQLLFPLLCYQYAEVDRGIFNSFEFC